MNANLTLSLDQDVIVRAKEWARKEGKTLSAIVEEYLDMKTRNIEAKSPSQLIRELAVRNKTKRPLTDAEIEKKKHDYLTRKYGGR